MLKKTVIFDFDGTIADTIPFMLKVGNDLAQEYGFKTVTQEEFSVLKDKSPFEIIHHLHIPLLKVPFIVHRGRQILKKYMKDIPYIKGMDTVLHSLKVHGYQVGMLTSNSKKNIDIFMNNNNLKVFDFIYTENNVFGKQFSLRKILKKEKLDINTTIYIGDEVRDIDACHVLSLDIISVTWGFSSKAALEKYKPTYIIDDPTEIFNILKQPLS